GNADKLKRLAGAKEIAVREKVDGLPAVVTPLGTLYLDLASSVDVAAERTRMGKELQQLDKQIASTEARLGNEKFVSQAPPEVVEGARRQLDKLRGKKEEIERLLAAL